MPSSPQPPVLFEEPVARWTLIGAILGGIAVVVMFAVGVALTDGDPALIGAAGLAAPFGGAGFGAMMGAVLGGIRAAELEAQERRATDEASSGARTTATTGRQHRPDPLPTPID